MGDFNLGKIDWSNFKLMPGHTPSESGLLQLIFENGLSQYVLKATYCDNILDLVISSHDHLVDNLSVVLPFSTSDHNSVIFDMECISTASTHRSLFFCQVDHTRQLDFSNVILLLWLLT